MSTNVRTGAGWPTGATPPIAWPVAARTASGVARSTDATPRRAATLAHALLDRGVLDEVLTSVAPVLLGDGTRLFTQPGGARVRLEQISVHTTPLAITTRYRVLR